LFYENLAEPVSDHHFCQLPQSRKYLHTTLGKLETVFTLMHANYAYTVFLLILSTGFTVSCSKNIAALWSIAVKCRGDISTRLVSGRGGQWMKSDSGARDDRRGAIFCFFVVK